MTLPDEVLKTDALGRVRVKTTRREALLDEFERGGTSAQAFAKLVGINYQTFASWVQKRRRARRQYPAVTVKTLPSTATTADAMRLVEAVVERNEDQAVATTGGESLCVHLPGGARMEVRDGRQARLAAELLRALATTTRPC